MKEAEFDRFADEYRHLHAKNIRLSGESPEFFAAYKVADMSARLAELSIEPPGAILDFGAGTGSSAPHFFERFPQSALTCIDVSRKSIEIGRKLYGDRARFIHFDGKRMPLDSNSFDLVLAACVFHHIETSEHVRLLAEILRVMRPGGSLFVFEHNPWNPLTVYAVNTCEFDKNAVLIRSGDMATRILRAGFSAIEIRYRLFFPAFARQLRRYEKHLVRVPLGAQYFVHARKPA